MFAVLTCIYITNNWTFAHIVHGGEKKKREKKGRGFLSCKTREIKKKRKKKLRFPLNCQLNSTASHGLVRPIGLYLQSQFFFFFLTFFDSQRNHDIDQVFFFFQSIIINA